MRLLMFGQTGQVATEVVRRAPGDITIAALGRDQADLSDPAACAAAIAGAEADVVLNAAAYTAVDRAEEETDLAQRINADAPGAMARACAEAALPFLHISTDYVFDGTGETPWSESDPVAPQNAYGRTKLAGEVAIAEAFGDEPRYAILRTSWVFSAHGGNFVKTMLRVAETRERLTVVDDQHGAPTAAADIADAVLTMARAFAGGQGTGGVFHFASQPDTTWCGFAREIFARAAWSKTPDVEGIPTADYPTPAVRPSNSRLDCTRLSEAYGIVRPDWRSSLDAVLAELAPR
ncbi:MAG: dTDP-4-dehydrorhamnose reductase [Pseudomonadota bacterium]